MVELKRCFACENLITDWAGCMVLPYMPDPHPPAKICRDISEFNKEVLRYEIRHFHRGCLPEFIRETDKGGW